MLLKEEDRFTVFCILRLEEDRIPIVDLQKQIMDLENEIQSLSIRLLRMRQEVTSYWNHNDRCRRKSRRRRIRLMYSNV